MLGHSMIFFLSFRGGVRQMAQPWRLIFSHTIAIFPSIPFEKPAIFDAPGGWRRLGNQTRILEFMTNFFKRLSPRSIRIIFTLCTIVVLISNALNFMSVMVYNATGNDQCSWTALPKEPGKFLISDIVPGGVAERAGIMDQDRLVKINGKKFDVPAQAQRLIDAVPNGDYATYSIERNGTAMEIRVKILKLFNVAFLGFFFLGLGFLIVGYVVVMTKPEGSLQRMFARYSLFAMLLFGFFGTLQQVPQYPWMTQLFRIGLLLGRIFAPPLFISFFFHFPVRRKVLDKKWVVPLLYVLSVLLIALILGAQLLTIPNFIIVALFVAPYAMYICGLLIFVRSYYALVEPGRRSQLRPILIGIAVGIVSALYIFILQIVSPFAVFLYPSSFIPGIFVVAVPISFGYSIFRYRLMDIDLIVKRSLIYAAITATIAAMYLLIVYGVGSMTAYFLGTEENRLLNIFAFILIALAFDPIKRRVQEWIDRFFYQERYNYQRALLEFSQELPRQMNLEQILHSILNRISGTMHVEKIAVVLCDEIEGCHSVSINIDDRCCQFSAAHNGLIALLRSRKQPQPLAFIGDDPELGDLNAADKESVLRSGIVLAVPMFVQNRMIGTINVGPKMSGRFYSQEDIDLLSTVASQAAIAIENARLHRSEIEKQKIEEELNMARVIQQGLLPRSNPVMDRLDIAGTSIPALSVGGDYYDFIEIAPNKLLVVVADVSGKGMSAALYMSKIQGMIQLAAHMYATPREMLVHVNRRLYDGIERKSFITMILALFDLEQKHVLLCRAGHNKAIIGSSGRFDFLDATGIGLGLERGPIFERSLEEITYPLSPDALFFLYSDGLSEAMDPAQRQFGEDAICREIEKHRSGSSARIQESVLAAVRDFQGGAEQHDDITMVVAKYR